MTGAVNYVGLAVAVLMGAGLGYAITRYIVEGEEYRKKHKKELIRTIVEGLIFMMLGYMVYWYG